ncbi:threonine/serine exporter family protein [Brevibacillus composti]|uniref:Threonine/serine exporter family protein n=1 Tax=Brevibacillus composti TaxID=2796470 RepID=A0A7T5JNV6_9BACL|nr:threonine/serine exporter family protein [Brevibacillus composti]QQE74579.1 threonine/serine exporter family protein [Brevibacillus composti]QUO41662.1 threonine/serine exporter family protein [Brevibacillus composti]
MLLLKGLGLSLLSSMAWGLLFNVPVRTLLACGFAGVTGWLIYFILPHFGAEVILSTFAAATSVSVLSQILSIWLRVPSTNFSVAGIIPLVPGSLAYKAMLAFVNGEYMNGITLAMQTAMVAGAIASGLILGISVLTIWRGARHARKRAH